MGLWRVSPEHPLERENGQPGYIEAAANVYNLPSIAQVIKYHHAAAGFPTKDTWVKAIKAGFYVSWPGLTAEAASKHFPESEETQKGHLKKQRQNVRSTKRKVTFSDDDEMIPQSITANSPGKQKFFFVKTMNAEGTIYTDQTGCFPTQSRRGNKFIMIIYDVDGNYIDGEPMRDHRPNSMIKAYHALWDRVTKNRVDKPMMHILDNEASADFKKEIRKNCNLQLVPPDTHRRNLAERAIQTFKSHFISILAGVDPAFP